MKNMRFPLLAVTMLVCSAQAPAMVEVESFADFNFEAARAEAAAVANHSKALVKEVGSFAAGFAAEAVKQAYTETAEFATDVATTVADELSNISEVQAGKQYAAQAGAYVADAYTKGVNQAGELATQAGSFAIDACQKGSKHVQTVANAVNSNPEFQAARGYTVQAGHFLAQTARNFMGKCAAFRNDVVAHFNTVQKELVVPAQVTVTVTAPSATLTVVPVKPSLAQAVTSKVQGGFGMVSEFVAKHPYMSTGIVATAIMAPVLYHFLVKPVKKTNNGQIRP